MDIQISPDMILKTKRLLLRYPQMEDAAEIFYVVNSPQFPEQLPLKGMGSIGEIEMWLARLQHFWSSGRVYSWIVEECDSGKLIGQVTLAVTEGEHRWALAFWIHPDQWGKGYATEAAQRVLAFGFDVIYAKKIWAGAGKWNRGSVRVLEKIGMGYLGDNLEGYTYQGEPIGTREYEIVRESWQKLHNK